MREDIMLKPLNDIVPSLKFTLECIDELVNEHREVCDYIRNVLSIKRWGELLTMDQETLAHAEQDIEYGCASGLYGETELFAVAAAAVWKHDAENRYVWDVRWTPLEKAIRSLTLLDSPAERAHYAAEFEDVRRRGGISQWTDLLRRNERDLCDIAMYAWEEYRGKVSGAIDDALIWRREMDDKVYDAKYLSDDE